MDDQRAGALLRALRRRRGMRQVDLAARAGVGQPTVSRAERGHLGSLQLSTIRALFAALDARIELEPRWRGGQIDRLVDERHSGLVAAAAEVFARCGWSPVMEVTYSIYGERGSIDLLGLHAPSGSVVLVEAKIEVTSFEEMQRRFDVKTRLMPRVVENRFGWRPRQIARIQVVTDTRTNRRRIDRVRVLVERGRSAMSEGSGSCHLCRHRLVVGEQAARAAFGWRPPVEPIRHRAWRGRRHRCAEERSPTSPDYQSSGGWIDPR